MPLFVPIALTHLQNVINANAHAGGVCLGTIATAIITFSFPDYFAVAKTVNVVRIECPGIKKKNGNGNGNVYSAHKTRFPRRVYGERRQCEKCKFPKMKHNDAKGHQIRKSGPQTSS